ncbi:MAG: segregation/condensation protein A [Bacteroidota bacterium]
MSTASSPTNETYRIELPQFEGPFDLLLFFIERDELDIHDIPIAKITQDFLNYMQAAQEMNIELAAEFILVASTLMRIKAKMLLPRPVLNEAGEEIDPREELVKRLLEYKRYKLVLSELVSMEADQLERIKRGFSKNEEKLFMQSEFPEEELHGMDLYTIMRAFQRIWEKHHEKIQKPRHVIRQYPYTVEEIKDRMLHEVSQTQHIDFIAFVSKDLNEIYIVFSFLAILELVQAQRLTITIGEGFNNFWLTRKEGEVE